MQLELEMAIGTKTIRTVSEITEHLKKLIELHAPFQNVWVQGQLSNVSRASSGHTYFTLKDEKNQISCVLFRGDAATFRFLPRNGEEVLIRGKIGVYGPQGRYQIRVSAVEPIGIGALQRAYEELKQRLAEEGLFDEAHKKPLPSFPRKIGVITSETGAAFQDICQQLRKRYPLAEVLLHPTLVQGDAAARGISEALRAMNLRDDIDVLIVGRGGGSLEDLWAFNEEPVARAIFASTIPVVSAVGHETDYTIADMVADHRAPTPSAAIEHIVPDQQELAVRLEEFRIGLHRKVKEYLEAHKVRLQELETRLSPARRKEAILHLHQTVDSLESACRAAINRQRSDAQNQLHTLAKHLNALSPLATLQRGYSITRKTDGGVLTSTAHAAIGDRIKVQLTDGHLVCRIEERLSQPQTEGTSEEPKRPLLDTGDKYDI